MILIGVRCQSYMTRAMQYNLFNVVAGESLVQGTLASKFKGYVIVENTSHVRQDPTSIK